MSLLIWCGECGKNISYGRATDRQDLEFNDGHFGVGPVHGYDGTCSGLSESSGGGKCIVNIPLVHLCETCFREKLPECYELISKKEMNP